MENNDVEMGNSESTDTESGGEEASTTEGQVTDGNAEVESAEKAAEETPEAEADNVEFVKDGAGKEFVPKEAFQKRVDALTAKWKEREELLTAIKEDPEVRKKFLGEMEQAKAEATAQSAPSPETKPAEDANGLKPINDWLAQLSESPEHQTFYKGYSEALLKTLDVSLSRYIDKRFAEFTGKEVAPLKQQIGQTMLAKFKAEHADFGKYESKVSAAMKQGKDINEAYRLAKYDDLVKELAAVKGGKSTNAAKSRDALKNTPISKRQTSSVSPSKSNNMSIDEAISESMRETGYGRK